MGGVRNPERQAALSSGGGFYKGKPCAKHADLHGLRHTRNSKCAGCHRGHSWDFGSARKARESGKIHYHGRMCNKHPDTKGLRRTANCVCIACEAENSKNKYGNESSEKRKIRKREARTGFSQELFDETIRIQGNRCPVCERLFDGKDVKPVADHCHDENKPRAVLCLICNSIEGFARKTGVPIYVIAKNLMVVKVHPPAELAGMFSADEYKKLKDEVSAEELIFGWPGPSHQDIAIH